MSVLTPLNDLYFTVYFEDADPTTFAATPVTTGVVTAFLATSNDPAAAAADPTLSVSALHVGVATPTPAQFPLGTWGISFPAASLTPTLLDSIFTNTPPYLIVVRANGARVYQKLKYVRQRAADN